MGAEVALILIYAIYAIIESIASGTLTYVGAVDHGTRIGAAMIVGTPVY